MKIWFKTRAEKIAKQEDDAIFLEMHEDKQRHLRKQYYENLKLKKAEIDNQLSFIPVLERIAFSLEDIASRLNRPKQNSRTNYNNNRKRQR